MSSNKLQIKQYLMSLRQGLPQQAPALDSIKVTAQVITGLASIEKTVEVKTTPVITLPQITEIKVEAQKLSLSWSQASLDFFNDMTALAAQKATALHAQYIEPINKEQVDKFIVSSIGFSTYYGLVSGAKLEQASSFTTRAEVSMGFKLFNAIANPVLAQFVESFTEVHTNNAKFLYYSAKCTIYGLDCEETAKLNNPFKISDFEDKSSLIQDFTQFDLKRYTNEASNNLDGINIKNLLSGGILSATASQVVDTVYEQSGLKPFVQGYWMKNWGTYYFKEWVKGELKHEANALKTKAQDVLGLNEANAQSQSTTKPLKISDIISHDNNDIVSPQASAASAMPLMDTITLQVPVTIQTTEIIL